MFDLGIPETSQGCVDFLGRIFPLEADRKVKRLKSELESEKAGARTNENWLVLTGTMESMEWMMTSNSVGNVILPCDYDFSER
jgi:hypothetical protein